MIRNLSTILLFTIYLYLVSGIGAYPTASSLHDQYTGQFSYIVDGDFSSSTNCLTMTGSWPYVTIDYGYVMSIKTIFILGYHDSAETAGYTWNNLQVYAHTEESEYSVQCPINPMESGFYDCHADA